MDPLPLIPVDRRKPEGGVAKIMEVAAVIAPFVFIAGLLLAVSTILHLVITVNSGLTKCLIN